MEPQRKRIDLKEPKRNTGSKRDQTIIESLPKGSLGDEAYEAIKWQILAMELAPGTFLNVQELSDRLGLGRSPVHYAVHRLQHDGLLEVIQRKGILVRSWSPKEIDQVVEARIPLEVAMVRLAAERATDAQLRALKARLAEGKKLVAARDRQGLMELDQDFHRGLADCADNPVIAEVLNMLHQRSTPLWSTAVAGQRDYAKVQEQHEKVLACIAARDADGAAGAIRLHLQALVRS